MLKKYHEEHQAIVIISSHNLNHTVDICPRIALMEHGIIIRDLSNEHNSAEKELEDYFDARIEEEQPDVEKAEELVEEKVEEKIEEIAKEVTESE